MGQVACRLLGLSLLAAAAAPAQEFRRLFDGETLKGWVQTGKGQWRVEDSALVGTLPANNPESYLLSEGTAKDFHLRLKFRWVRGNSGVNFRNERKGDLSMGLQSDLDGNRTSGWLYDNVKAAYVATSDSVPRWYRGTGWNDLAIEAEGARIRVFLNGKRTVEYQDAGGRKEGVFAFQLHAGQAMEVWFRDIEMRDLNTPNAVLAWPPRAEAKGILLIASPDGRLRRLDGRVSSWPASAAAGSR